MDEALVAADETLAMHEWTVGDLLSWAAERAGERPALRQDSLEWTYAQLRTDSRALARFLLTRFAPRDRVAIWGANSAPWILYQLAAAQAGLVLVTLNPALRGGEVEALLKQSRACGLLLEGQFRGIDLVAEIASRRDALPQLREVLLMADWQAHIASAPESGELPIVRPEDDALLLYTSGTTGTPKGVVLHHRGIVNNAVLGASRYELDEGLAWLGVLPYFHVGGSVTTTLGCMARTGMQVVIAAFEPGYVLEQIERQRIAWFPCVPTMAIALIENPRFEATDLSSLQLVLTGGTVITPDFIGLVREKFGVGIQVMFGQTEAGGALCKTLRNDPPAVIAQTVGRPYPHTAMRIAAIDDGRTLSYGEIGEIRVKSPFMTRGYFDNPQATNAVFDEGGWLRTGDLGSLDAKGYLRITGRLKEMIIRGGENIYPREIEDRLGEYPGVSECAVLGLPDPRWGEEVAVAVRPLAGAQIDLDAARQFLRERIARHKVPRLWFLVEDFPRTPSGKIQKHELAALLTRSAVS